jgi:hypothetical protein
VATEEVAAPVIEEAQKEENEGDDGKDGGEENEQVRLMNCYSLF